MWRKTGRCSIQACSFFFEAVYLVDPQVLCRRAPGPPVDKAMILSEMPQTSITVALVRFLQQCGQMHLLGNAAGASVGASCFAPEGHKSFNDYEVIQVSQQSLHAEDGTNMAVY